MDVLRWVRIVILNWIGREGLTTIVSFNRRVEGEEVNHPGFGGKVSRWNEQQMSHSGSMPDMVYEQQEDNVPRPK